MNKKPPQYVTVSLFKKEIKKIHQSLATKIELAQVAAAVVKTQGDVEEIKRNMATKADIDRALNQMDEFAKNTDLALRNQEIHRGYLHDHELRLTALEKQTSA